GTDAAPIHFHGESAEAVSVAAPADPIPALTDGNRTLQVTIDGVVQTVSVPAGNNVALADVVDFINSALIGGFAHRTAGKIAIGSNPKGKLSSVSVKANATFGFTADVSASGNTIPANDVGNLNKVTADEINGLLAAASIPVHASFSANLG